MFLGFLLKIKKSVYIWRKRMSPHKGNNVQLLLPKAILRLSMPSQVKPVHRLCGTTRPGATSTKRSPSPPSWPRTSSTQSSPAPKSSSCLEIQWRGTVGGKHPQACLAEAFFQFVLLQNNFPGDHVCFKLLLL